MFQFRRFPRCTYFEFQYNVPEYEPRWVSSFRNLRINAYLQLPEAYRSLSRLSSAPSAKAFALRPCSLDLSNVLSEHLVSSWFSLLPTKIIVTLPFEIAIFLKRTYYNLCFAVIIQFSRYVLVMFLKARSPETLIFITWWAKMDSNHRPHDYQSCALASWAIGPFLPLLFKSACFAAPSKLNNVKLLTLCTDLRTLQLKTSFQLKSP